MKTSLFLVAGAAVAILGGAALAAQKIATHEMTVRLPDGGVAKIEYAGQIPPRVHISNLPITSRMDWMWAGDPLFADMERISAGMDQVWADFDREMASLVTPSFITPAVPDGAIEAAIRNAPAGTVSYSFVSASNLGGSCMQSIEVSQRAGEKPHVVKQTSGNCEKSGRVPTDVMQKEQSGLMNANASDQSQALEPAVLRR